MAEQPEAPTLVLTATSPTELRGRTYLLENDGCDRYIGRSANADVSIDHETVSHRHVRLRWHGTAIVVRDLCTRWGSWQNGTRFVGARYLHAADILRLGDVELHVAQLVPAAT